MPSTARFFFPFLGWLKGYGPALLRKDVLAGFSVALVLVPQSMANAQLAGLPAYHGIYAALFPAFAGGLWGSSRQMVTGTVAVLALMSSAALAPLLSGSPEAYIAHMALLTLLVGGVQLALGLCRMGIIVNFLSLPVISGFINASAIIIACSQLSKLLGVRVDSAEREYQTLLLTLESALDYVHIPSVLFAVLALVIMWACKRFAPRVPAVLAAVVITTAISWLCGFERSAVGPVDAIADERARELLILLAGQHEELAVQERKLSSLMRERASTKADDIELNYRREEQELAYGRLQRDIGLAREHLRRTLFTAELLPGGERIFRVIQDPGLVRTFKRTDAPDTEESEDARAHNAARPSSTTATRLERGTWRLSLGTAAPDLNKLSFSGGGAVVGYIPAGLPHFAMPNFSWSTFMLLLPQALIIAFVGFAEAISIGKAAANQFGYRLDANQELVGQGLANISGGLTLTCPVTGSFSSSAVNISAGAATGISCIVASLGAFITLMFFTPALAYLPQPVLAAVVLRAVGSLVHLEEFRRVWTAQWYDGLTAIITFGATLFFAPHLDYGIMIGVALSLIFFFYRSMRPTIVTLSVGHDRALHDARAFRLNECRHIAVVHFQGPLFFANAGLLEDYVIGRLESQKDLRHIHLVCTGITHMDASGEESLAMLARRAKEAGVGISFSGVVGSVAKVLERTGVLEAVGWENIFLTPREALCNVHARLNHDADCTDCPLQQLFCSDFGGQKHISPLESSA